MDINEQKKPAKGITILVGEGASNYDEGDEFGWDGGGRDKDDVITSAGLYSQLDRLFSLFSPSTISLAGFGTSNWPSTEIDKQFQMKKLPSHST